MRQGYCVYRTVLYIVICVCIGISSAVAQSSFVVTSFTFRYPTVRVFFKARCNGKPVYAFDKERDILLTEDGVAPDSFSFGASPSAGMERSASMAFLFDAGGMSAEQSEDAKRCAATCVSWLDGLEDEACIFSAGDPMQSHTALTTDTSVLRSSIAALTGSGDSYLWDNLYNTIIQLAAQAANPALSIVLFTDGTDCGSARSSQEVLDLALQLGCRIFPVMLQSGNDADALRTVAENTGGASFFLAAQNEIPSIGNAIEPLAHALPGECCISYKTKGMDGSTRTMRLDIEFCGSTSTIERSFVVPRDSTTFDLVSFECGNGSGMSGGEVVLPLKLTAPYAVGIDYPMGPADFKLAYDPNSAHLECLTAPSGGVLKGACPTFEDQNGYVTISVPQQIALGDTGILFYMHFSLADVDDTTYASVELLNWIVDRQSVRGIFDDGEICILPRHPSVQGMLEMPDVLSWEPQLRSYDPNPFTITSTVINTGQRTASNAMFTIDVDPASVQLLSPVRVTQPGTFVHVPVNGISRASWSLRAKPRTQGDSVVVTVTVWFDNHPDIVLTRKIWIPPAEPVLTCSTTKPQVFCDYKHQRYCPMPVPLTLRITNAGPIAAKDIAATITLPHELSLVSDSDGTQWYQQPQLHQGETIAMTWNITHPITTTKETYHVGMWVKAYNADSCYCETEVVIPALGDISLRMSSAMPHELEIDSVNGEYIPNPFPVSIDVVNKGSMIADSVTVFLYLPNGAELDPPSQSQRYVFGTLPVWRVGDTIPTHVWMVRWTRKDTIRTYPVFRWSCSGIGRDSHLLKDSVYAYHEIKIPEFLTNHTCSVSLAQNYPNPFNPTTEIAYILPERDDVTLFVTDALGRRVCTLSDGIQDAGAHRVTFDAGSLPSGMYFSILQTSAGTRTRTMLLKK